jgi:hypothetical protein
MAAPWERDWSGFAAAPSVTGTPTPVPNDAAPANVMPWQRDWSAASQPAPEGTGMDVARSALSGAATGLAGLPGAAGDVQKLAANSGASDWLTRKAEQWFPTLTKALEDSSKPYAHLADRGDVVAPVPLPTTDQIKRATTLDATDAINVHEYMIAWQHLLESAVNLSCWPPSVIAPIADEHLARHDVASMRLVAIANWCPWTSPGLEHALSASASAWHRGCRARFDRGN